MIRSFLSRFRARPAPRTGFSVRAGGERPDIVLFLTDEQRYDEVGYASDGYYETPALERLAARGVIFEAAYSGSTVCVPARASLLTGLAHHRVQTQANGVALREGFWTVARALRDVGYQTALVGKMHFSPMYADHGFDTMKLAEHLVPFSGYSRGEVDDYHRFLLWRGLADHPATHMFGEGLDAARESFEAAYLAQKFPYDRSVHPIGWIASTAVDVLSQRKRAPLFLVVSFPRPHAPFDPAEPYASMYDPRAVRLPEGGVSINDGLPEAFRNAFVGDPMDAFQPFPASRLPDDVYRRVLAYVRALVRQVDDAMSDVLARLDLARSVVFFTSDHGTFGGHRGVLGKVPWIPFDDLARVPLVCSAPGSMPRTRVRAPVQTLDFAATCLDYAGIEPPEGLLDGVSLKTVLQGGTAPERRAVFSSGSGGWPMVRIGDHKLIRCGLTEVLFDLAKDPQETRNVHDDPAYEHALFDLRAAMDRVLARTTPELLAAPPTSVGAA